MDHIVHYDPRLPAELPSPCYVVDLQRLESNLAILESIQQATECKILCALKGFAMHSVFPLLSRSLAGVCASGPHEARLGAELFGREVHVFAPAFSLRDMEELLPIAKHISFNSFSQWNLHRGTIEKRNERISCGLRVNPGYSEIDVEIYDPCAPGSRLGIPLSEFEGQSLECIEGLHFHALCEQNAGTLERVLEVFISQFGQWLPKMKWVNFGGGHHITSPVYDRDRLIRILNDFRSRFPHLEVYLEPGEAIAINTGVLAASVLDIAGNDIEIAILDISATCHMPDTLEMPYRPEVVGAGQPGQRAYTYRLGGLSCLAGDVIGDYSFDAPLRIGDRIQFLDMAHYTMVKTTTFNGIKHPAIATWDPRSDTLNIVREFGYKDYKERLS